MLLEISFVEKISPVVAGWIEITTEEGEWIRMNYRAPANLRHKKLDLYVELVEHAWYGGEMSRIVLDPLIMERSLSKGDLLPSKPGLIKDPALSTRRLNREFLRTKLAEETCQSFQSDGGRKWHDKNAVQCRNLIIMVLVLIIAFMIIGFMMVVTSTPSIKVDTGLEEAVRSLVGKNEEGMINRLNHLSVTTAVLLGILILSTCSTFFVLLDKKNVNIKSEHLDEMKRITTLVLDKHKKKKFLPTPSTSTLTKIE